MNIKYNLLSNTYSYQQNNPKEIEKLNFLLTNTQGDFLNLGVQNNSSKFFGLNILNSKTSEIFKFIDEIIPERLEVDSVEHKGFAVHRSFKSSVINEETFPVNPELKKDDTFGDEGSLTYSDDGQLVETVNSQREVCATDSFFLGPTGGMIYEINNYDGNLFLDLDMKKRDDFGEWGRIYKVSEEKGIVFVEFSKELENKKNEYKLYLGIQATNLSYNILEEWVRKEYSYSKIRNSLHERFVYRPLKINITNKQKIVFGTGFSKDEVLEQIELLSKHEDELENLSRNMFFEMTSDEEFEKPLNQDVSVAYKLSKDAIYGFRTIDKKGNSGLYAGYPWFSDIWSRDEIISLRAFINLEDYNFVKGRIFNYLDQISEESGGINILPDKKSNTSCDSVFYLVKRIEDLIFKLTEKEILHKTFSDKELENIYHKLNFAFNRLVKTNWDFDKELLNVKYADSWMDTVHLDYPLEIQVGFLEMVSFMAFLGKVLDKKEESLRYLDLEETLREKIRQEYFKYDNLYNELYLPKVTCNVFLVYYLYPDLFYSHDWEIIFDNALKVLKTKWGGIASLSNKEREFKEEYSGENNLSYHRGDSWFWINNIAAIAMNSLNERKYRSEIAKILISSTNDILKFGTIGFSSEISSYIEQRAEGCQAQLWSSSTYIEMIDKLFLKK